MFNDNKEHLAHLKCWLLKLDSKKTLVSAMEPSSSQHQHATSITK